MLKKAVMISLMHHRTKQISTTFQTHSLQQSSSPSLHSRVVQHDNMATAVQRALNTIELLEAIFLELPPRTLMLSQRVNTRFKGVIESSINVQQKLFLQPPPRAEDGTTAVNPFLQYVPSRLGICCVMFVTTAKGGIVELRMGSTSLMSNKRRVVFSGDRISVSVFNMHLGNRVQMPLRGSFIDMLIADVPLEIEIDMNYKSRTTFKTVTVNTIGDLIEACCAH